MVRSALTFLFLLVAVQPARGEGETLDSVLQRLDDRAAEIEGGLFVEGKKDPHVAALVARSYAGRLDDDRAYAVATYSFEHAIRDDVRLVRNDWDIEYGNGDDQLGVRMVVDDASRIWDMGEVDFDAFTVRAVKEGLPKGGERAVATESHLYVIHTLDSETDLWAKMQVVELQPGQAILIRWEVIEDPTDVEQLERTEDRMLTSGRVRIQIRAGAMGGNPGRVHMDGSVWAYIDEVSRTPLDPPEDVDNHHRECAYIDGGLIPRGKVWIMRSIEYQGTNLGDSNGAGRFILSAGGREIARVEERSGAFKDTWRGRIVVRPREEHGVWAEISNSSWCDVTFRGALVDEKWADAAAGVPLSKPELERMARLVGDLDADDAELRDAAVRDLVEMGPPVLEHLLKLPTTGRSPEFQTRLGWVIEALGGE